MSAGTETLTQAPAPPKRLTRYLTRRRKSVGARSPPDRGREASTATTTATATTNSGATETATIQHRRRAKSLAARTPRQAEIAPGACAVPDVPQRRDRDQQPPSPCVVTTQQQQPPYTPPALQDHHRPRTSGVDWRREWEQQLEKAADKRRRDEEREAALYAAEVTRLEAEADRILAEQKEKDLARLEAELAAAQSRHPDRYPRDGPDKSSSKPRSPILDRFDFLTRALRPGTSDENTMSPTSSSSITSAAGDRTPATSLEQSPPSRAFIAVGGRGIVPQMDAPASASNAGERRITVRCLNTSINLPVTPETTPRDILYSSANLMTHRIVPGSSILVECFQQLGLERRLRRYERVRDIMNSWDRDAQNSLLVLPCDEADGDSELDLASVRRSPDPPRGRTLLLHHCQRPGRWQKRHVTLLESGQLFAPKKSDGRLADKDSQALCHLSDFDIYTPSDAEMRRNLKPPKRFCYAVKSQQKTAVFVDNMDNFIHYFCADEEETALLFHDAIHRWRSWYLVNKRMDLPSSQPKSSGQPASKALAVATSGSHRLKVSIDNTPYTIGAFEPLMDMNRFDKPLDDFGKDFLPTAETTVAKTAAATARTRDADRSKPMAKTRQPAQPVQTAPAVFGREHEFASSGLLGNAYDERAKHANERSRQPGPADGPFIAGPSLLNGSPPAKLQPQAQTQTQPQPQSRSQPEPADVALRMPPQERPARQLPKEPAARDAPARYRGQKTQSPRSATSPQPLGSGNGPSGAREQAASPTSRPKTSDGPPSRYRAAARPLVDLSAPQVSEPQSWRAGHGHGIRAPTGVPLISMATGKPIPAANPTVPRNAAGDAGPAPPGLIHAAAQARTGDARSRSRSLAGAKPPLSPANYPPVPSVPVRGLLAQADAEHASASQQQADSRDRQLMRGRAGTLRTC